MLVVEVVVVVSGPGGCDGGGSGGVSGPGGCDGGPD